MADREWISSSAAYLAPPKDPGREAWSAELERRGRRGSQRIVQAGEVPSPAEAAALLGLAVGESVVVRRRVMFVEERPCELTDTYYPVRIARGTGLASTAKIRGGAVRLLAELGHTGVRVVEDVTARLPTDKEQNTLLLTPDQPVLTIARVTFDDEGAPVQADLMTMPAHLQRLRYETRIG
ncbi:UTRA domain-containing protein [Streptomyces sp. NBC_01497]|uniref:UTRA domain-containing protein n=1 Tax=Streptomyces sp. NBC_01497 TaxID=2903885 RepID=UPI002E319B64|nr:UTRA domain-containing protein [Streptomyces sp. NBC_01497]